MDQCCWGSSCHWSLITISTWLEVEMPHWTLTSLKSRWFSFVYLLATDHAFHPSRRRTRNGEQQHFLMQSVTLSTPKTQALPAAEQGKKRFMTRAASLCIYVCVICAVDRKHAAALSLDCARTQHAALDIGRELAAVAVFTAKNRAVLCQIFGFGLQSERVRRKKKSNQTLCRRASCVNGVSPLRAETSAISLSARFRASQVREYRQYWNKLMSRRQICSSHPEIMSWNPDDGGGGAAKSGHDHWVGGMACQKRVWELMRGEQGR